MLAIEFEPLSALGLTPALANRAAGLAVGADARRWNCCASRRSIAAPSTCTTGSPSAAPACCRDWPARLPTDATALAVGDWVLAARDAHGETWIDARVPPSSHIARRDGDGRVHPVVSNVDTALLVMGLDDDFNPRRLERYLALVRGDAIVPVVVLTKADVAASTAGALDERLALLEGRIPAGTSRSSP